MTDWAMKDADFKKQMERLRGLERKWETVLGLRMQQKVTFEYWREPLPSQAAHAGTDEVVAATCVADWQYLTATVKFCLPLCQDMPDEELENLFLHECSHILVNEMRALRADGPDWLDHEERVVTQLSMILGWVREAGREDSKRKGKK